MAFTKTVYSQGNNFIDLKVDVAQKGESVKNSWAYFGYDEPNYTYMPNGKKLLTELAALSPVPVYVRTHNLLTSGDGKADLKWGSTNAYTEDSQGNPVYNWRIVDSIFDTFVQRGMKPIAEIGFMPEALSIHPQPYKHSWKPGLPYPLIYTGWTYPPTDYNKWSALVYAWVVHCIERYGMREVSSWWWEVWNEPNIGYWKGTTEEYFKLYDYAADAVKKACPDARIGGPTTTGPSWDSAALFLKDFLKHCQEGRNYATGKTGSPLDYISFHAKGRPEFVKDHVRMNMSPQLADVETGFSIVAASPFRNLPVIIGECDPEGCAACGMATNPENAYRNGTLYSSYTAASFARIHDLAKRYNVQLEGIVSWSFEFENQPWFYGFRDLATHGIDKPVLNVFRMFGLMKGQYVPVTNPFSIPLDSIIRNSVRGNKPDIGIVAAADSTEATAMIWNYHDENVPKESSTLRLSFESIPSRKIKVLLYRIDRDYSNAYELWKKRGSLQDISPDLYRRLEIAGQLHSDILHKRKKIQNGQYILRLSLPSQGVYLVRLLYL